MSSPKLARKSLLGKDLRGANLENKFLGFSDLRGALLDGAQMAGASLRGAMLSVESTCEEPLELLRQWVTTHGVCLKMVDLEWATINGVPMRNSLKAKL